MVFIRHRPLLVVLLLLAFCCQTLAAATMHCRGEHRPRPAQTQHHEHHHDLSPVVANDQAADCCSNNGQCLMACSVALASASLPPAYKISSIPLDNDRSIALAGVVTSVYKPPIFA